jgi:hypothetical protein
MKLRNIVNKKPVADIEHKEHNTSGYAEEWFARVSLQNSGEDMNEEEWNFVAHFFRCSSSDMAIEENHIGWSTFHSHRLCQNPDQFHQLLL